MHENGNDYGQRFTDHEVKTSSQRIYSKF